MKNYRVLSALISGLLVSSNSMASADPSDCIQSEQRVHAANMEQVFTCANRGDSTAQTHLGRMYHLGIGVAINLVMAAKWYTQAAYQGDPEAQFNLGVMYLDGTGVTENSAEALRWIAQAARQKHSAAVEVYNYILNNDGPLEC